MTTPKAVTTRFEIMKIAYESVPEDQRQSTRALERWIDQNIPEEQVYMLFGHFEGLHVKLIHFLQERNRSNDEILSKAFSRHWNTDTDKARLYSNMLNAVFYDSSLPSVAEARTWIAFRWGSEEALSEKIHAYIEEHLDQVNGFLTEIEAICRKYGLSISHEDCQGSFQITNYSEDLLDWIKKASIEIVDPPIHP